MLLFFATIALSPAEPLSELANTALLSEEPDAICLTHGAEALIPLGLAGEWVDLDVHTEGPDNLGPRALDGTLRFEDGTQLEIYAWLGKQIAPYLISGEDSQSILLGTGPDGPVFGQRWRVATAGPDKRVQHLRLKNRLAKHRVCITQVRVHSDAPLPQRTDTTDWYSFVVDKRLTAPPQSHPVQGPAIQAVHRGEDGHLFFESGERARFWGVNLTQRSAIPPKEEADAYAAMLAGLGFNAVRLHHIDGQQAGLVNPQRHKEGEPTLVPERLDALDFFVSRLKAHGIYLFLEVATQRDLGPKDGLPKTGALPNGHKLASIFRPRWTAAYLDAFEAMWGRENPYTGTTYGEEPAIAMLELSNEHSLLSNWGAGIEGLHREHLRILDALWNRWLLEKYENDAALNQAWAGSASHGRLQAGERLAQASVQRQPLHPALRYAYPHRRVSDLNDFYVSLEQGFYEAVAAKAKDLGFTQPVVASMSFGRPQLQQIYSKWDAADMHLEWGQTQARRILDNRSALANPRAHLLLESAAFAVEGQAFLVTELNHPFPNRFMAEAPLLWATLASVQDWDALIWMDWLLDSPPDRKGFVHSQFDLSHATVKTAQMPSASSLFRSGQIAPAQGFFPIYRSPTAAKLQGLYGKTALPWPTQDVNFWLRHRIRTVLGEQIRPEVEGVDPEGIDWQPEHGRLVIDQAGLQAVIGPPSNHTASRLDPHLKAWAAVSLASGDGQPLASSGVALLTIATRQENTGMAWDLNQNVIRSWGTAPVRIEPAMGSIRFAWSGRPIVEVLGQDGEPIRRIKAHRSGHGWWSIRLDEKLKSPWIRIRRP
jgi:hypothetical protein